MSPRVSDLLDEAVARAIITPEQRDQLRALSGDPADGPRGLTGEILAWAREAPRGFNAITISYGVGALAVISAFVWFLADRWGALGPPGVLGVSILYVAIFAVAARIFSREKFPTAHGVALLLIVLTVPLVAWATMRVTGIWTDDPYLVCRDRAAPFFVCRSQPMVLAGFTLVAVFAALRRLRFSLLMVPGAASLAIIFTVAALEVSRGTGTLELVGWSFTFSASVLAAIAYETDRRGGREDYGRWLHLAAAICAAIALMSLFNTERAARHLLLPTSVVAMAASLPLRRIIWLVFGLGALFSYLTWLATEVFERVVAFPIILGMVGMAVILVTVWVQRAYPKFATRVREQHGAKPQFPGGSALLLAPALVAVLVMPAARESAQLAQEARRAVPDSLQVDSLGRGRGGQEPIAVPRQAPSR